MLRSTGPTSSGGELRLAISLKGDEGIALLAQPLNWASRCQIPAFVELGRKIRRHRVPIEQSLRSGTSGALARLDQHQGPGPHSHGVRLRLPRGPDRHDHALDRRVLPRPARSRPPGHPRPRRLTPSTSRGSQARSPAERSQPRDVRAGSVASRSRLDLRQDPTGPGDLPARPAVSTSRAPQTPLLPQRRQASPLPGLAEPHSQAQI